MATVQKFLFDTSFDEPDSEPARKTGPVPVPEGGLDDEGDMPRVDDDEQPYAGLDRRRRSADAPLPEPPPNLYTAAQVDAAREEGYLKGHTVALEEAGASTARLTAAALKDIVAAFDRMDAEQRAFNAEVEKSATRLALTIARHLLPAAAEAGAVPEIERLVAATLPDVLDQPRLVIRVHGSLAEAIRQAVRPIQDDHGFEGRLTVRPDNDLPVGDCRLEWGDGGVERDTVRLWAEIEAVVARYLDEIVPPPSPPRPDATGAPEADRTATPGEGEAQADQDSAPEQGEHHG
ncbi:FliH/SctL family protein [Roseospira visakhapatnamensis]|uniref:Flagellar assembly protein FliH n=1 Tax=Roseospira visakhapatnamensis TaxID=390880 RepID=A0A7W6RBN3_9PROT|nr:FliH/SctL family protein [Roseospira visakhapatnamensis]MBB4265392.1 flagellar assembly protein FliH [Roseospira visakhapatnamensis]